MRDGKARKLSAEETEAAEFARLQQWDAEIEADYQRTVRATKVAGQRKRGIRFVGFPLAFLADVCRLTDGRTALVLAVYIYRRTCVCRSRTVTLPAVELADLGITRPRKHEALAKLEAAGLIRVERVAGRTAKVILTWQAH
jgi:hypothetical protein